MSAHGRSGHLRAGRNATATAEHTLAMMLAATRRIPQTHRDLTGGTWRGDYYMYDNVGPELEGSTVGLVGYGAIGSRVARMLGGFGAEVLVFDPYVTSETLGSAAEQVDLDELLTRSRIVSLHARVTPETTGMIGAAQIAAMPAGSVIVNCERGALLDYDAVCDALDSGHLFGAAFDVFPEEPIPAGSRLLSTPNIVMTPPTWPEPARRPQRTPPGSSPRTSAATCAMNPWLTAPTRPSIAPARHLESAAAFEVATALRSCGAGWEPLL